MAARLRAGCLPGAARPNMDDMGWLGLFTLAVLLPTITAYAVVFAMRG